MLAAAVRLAGSYCSFFTGPPRPAILTCMPLDAPRLGCPWACALARRLSSCSARLSSVRRRWMCSASWRSLVIGKHLKGGGQLEVLRSALESVEEGGLVVEDQGEFVHEHVKDISIDLVGRFVCSGSSLPQN